MPDPNAVPDYAMLDAVLSDAGIESSAEEIHGLLCGVVSRSGGDAVSRSAMLDTAMDSLGSADQNVRQILGRIADSAAYALGEGQMQFDLMVPGTEAGIRARADSLGIWCQGYIMGLALGGSTGIKVLSHEGREAVADLIQISGAIADEEGDVESQDRALSEIEEFVRVAVQLLFEEYRRANETPVADGGGGD